MFFAGAPEVLGKRLLTDGSKSELGKALPFLPKGLA